MEVGPAVRCRRAEPPAVDLADRDRPAPTCPISRRSSCRAGAGFAISRGARAQRIPTISPGVRQLDRWRRLHPRDERLHRDGAEAGAGLPGRAAAREDGDRRESRRRDLGGAEMHARESGVADYLAATSATRYASAARSSRTSIGARPRRRARADRRAALRRRRAARHRVDRYPRAVRFARGDRAHRRRLPVLGVQAAIRLDAGVRLGASARVSDRHPRATTASCSRSRRRRARNSSSCATRSTSRWCSCRTSPASWSAQKYEQEGIIKHGAKLINAVSNSTVPAITIMIGASLRRWQLRDDAAARTRRGSCSPGRTIASR